MLLREPVSVVLFGLIHVYQGSAGMVLTGISGLIYAGYYYHAGRIVPLMIAHYFTGLFPRPFAAK